MRKKLISLLFFVILLPLLNKPVFAIHEEYFSVGNNTKVKTLEINTPLSQDINPTSDFGSIEIHFHTLASHLQGSIQFILMENGNIIYSNNYPIEKIIPDNYFPFGFQTIRVNKNSKYKYELELITINKPQTLQVWYDDTNTIDYKISGERSIMNSFKFFFMRNIITDPIFFLFYSLLIIIMIVIILKI